MNPVQPTPLTKRGEWIVGLFRTVAYTALGFFAMLGLIGVIIGCTVKLVTYETHHHGQQQESVLLETPDEVVDRQEDASWIDSGWPFGGDLRPRSDD